MLKMFLIWCMVFLFVGLLGFGWVRLLMYGWCRFILFLGLCGSVLKLCFSFFSELQVLMCGYLGLLFFQMGIGDFQQWLWLIDQLCVFLSYLLNCLCLMFFGIQVICLLFVSMLFLMFVMWMNQFDMVLQIRGFWYCQQCGYECLQFCSCISWLLLWMICMSGVFVFIYSLLVIFVMFGRKWLLLLRDRIVGIFVVLVICWLFLLQVGVWWMMLVLLVVVMQLLMRMCQVFLVLQVFLFVQQLNRWLQVILVSFVLWSVVLIVVSVFFGFLQLRFLVYLLSRFFVSRQWCVEVLIVI